MKCPKCHKEVNDDNKYCPYCGAKLPEKIDPALEEIKELRRQAFFVIINRILNIASLVAMVFVIIGIFGPCLTINGSNETYNIGGLSWFVYDGWNMLNNGQLSVGPFYTTFILYILYFASAIALTSHGIYKAINALRKRSACNVIPHIIALTIIHRVYVAFINNFYYEYVTMSKYSHTTGTGWGDVTYNVAIPLFIIGLIAMLALKAIFTGQKRKIISTIFVLIGSFTLLNCIDASFTCLGFQDLNIGEQDIFGTLHYFDLIYNVSVEVTVSLLIMFSLGVIFIGLIIATIITSIRNLVKYDKIDKKLFLTLAIALNAVAALMLIDSIVFSVIINNLEGFYDNIFYLNSDLLLIIFIPHIVLGFAIAMLAMGEDRPIDDNIIDQEVIAKEETEA